MSLLDLPPSSGHESGCSMRCMLHPNRWSVTARAGSLASPHMVTGENAGMTRSAKSRIERSTCWCVR
jgi:hypothetical protein